MKCLPCLEDLEYMDDRFRIRLFSWSGGLLFALGWWLFIDSGSQAIHQHDELHVKAQLYLIGVGSTLAFFVIVLMDFEALTADEYTYHGGKWVAIQARFLLAFTLALALACIILSIYVLSHVYVHHNGIGGKKPDSVYPGVALLFQNVLICLSGASMRMGRVEQ